MTDTLKAMKVCGRCGESKPRGLFNRDKSRVDGRYPVCKQCRVDYYATHRVSMAVSTVELPQTRDGKTKVCSMCLRRLRHRRFPKNRARWDGRSAHCRACEEQRTRDHQGENREKAQEPLVDFTPDELEARLSMFGHRCWVCGVEGAEAIDHIKPLAEGGVRTLTSLRPICDPCDSAKRELFH